MWLYFNKASVTLKPHTHTHTAVNATLAVWFKNTHALCVKPPSPLFLSSFRSQAADPLSEIFSVKHLKRGEEKRRSTSPPCARPWGQDGVGVWLNVWVEWSMTRSALTPISLHELWLLLWICVFVGVFQSSTRERESLTLIERELGFSWLHSSICIQSWLLAVVSADPLCCVVTWFRHKIQKYSDFIFVKV